MSEKQVKESQKTQDRVVCPECIKNDIYSELINYSIDLKLQISLCPKLECTYPFGTGNINEYFVGKKENENLFAQKRTIFTDNCLINEESQTLFKGCDDESKVENHSKIPMTFCQNEVGKEVYFLHSTRNQGQGKKYNHLLF